MSDILVEDLRVELADGTAVVEHVSFSIGDGRVLGLVGESGCGKTTAAMALLAFARPGSAITGGHVFFDGRDLLALRPRDLQAVRGGQISFVPQDPAASLNPAKRVGRQIEEMLLRRVRDRIERQQRVLESLRSVRLEPAEAYAERYPHQLSGGEQQRVAIAMALVCQPRLVVLDEPTTGLDVTTQARILELITELQQVGDMSLLYVSHDLGVVAHLADRVVVMYGGRVVEEGSTSAVFGAPRHPYTRKLLAAMPRSDTSGHEPVGIPGTAVAPSDRRPGCPFAPRCDVAVARCTMTFPTMTQVGDDHAVACYLWDSSAPPVATASRGSAKSGRPAAQVRLSVEDVFAGYGRRLQGRSTHVALSGVSVQVEEGECVAIVGESGSGKTTLARCIVGIHSVDSGEIRLDGQRLAGRARDRTAAERQQVQIIFQNPDESLNPRHTVESLVARPVAQFEGVSAATARLRAHEALEMVRLDPAVAGRYPRELSGGEKQRVAIARALVAKPTLLVCDEITSALDVSVQAALLELLGQLRTRVDMSVVFVSHDLAVVRSLADRIVVLEAGHLRELGSTDAIFAHPAAPYTRTLMSAQQEWSLETSAAVSERPENALLRD